MDHQSHVRVLSCYISNESNMNTNIQIYVIAQIQHLKMATCSIRSVFGPDAQISAPKLATPRAPSPASITKDAPLSNPSQSPTFARPARPARHLNNQDPHRKIHNPVAVRQCDFHRHQLATHLCRRETRMPLLLLYL